MENLLIPQVCMDIDEAPIDIGKDDTSDDNSSESQEPEIGDDEKVKLLLEEEFLNGSQVPEELTEFENKAKKNVFAAGEPAVQFQRLHCTACNVHLGSAPIGHFNRYIHPLLKVLLCKACYDFYCSGEFDKDEDGSEMYCRWCGQGGKVMCCAQCAYVFCQKCVRQNLGKRTLEIIKDSDDWLCFGCNPTQLINLKIICTTLYEFVRKEIRLSKSLNNIERLKIDHSMCCQKVKAAKRKRDEDTPYTPHTDWKEAKSRKISIVKSAVPLKPTIPDNAKITEWDKKEQAEVVCTPDLLSLMEDDPPPLTPAPKEVNKPASTTAAPETNTKTQITPPVKPIQPEGKKLYTIAPKTMMVCNTNNFPKNTANFVRFQAPSIKFVPSVNRLVPIVNSIPAQILPGTKHEWYDKAAAVISTITTNLSVTLTNLTKEQRNAKSVEQLANVHNKLQELLSSSVNSLIQVRKNLRTEFLDDLNKLKFSNSYYKNNNRIAPKPVNISHTKNGDEDDDDVIVVTSENSSVTPLTEPPPLVKISSTVAASNSRPYLKVRSVSQLLNVSSECITIPDDPPGSSTIDQDVIPVEEDDPLEICSSIPNQSSVNGNKSQNEVPVMKNSTEFNGIDLINKNNALVEERIQQLVLENMKLQVSDIPQEELKRVLSVRVLISTNFDETLPSNRLKNSACSPNDAETNLNEIQTQVENEENQCELTGTSRQSDVAINDTNIDVQNIQKQDDHQTHATESESLVEESTQKSDGSYTPVKNNQDCADTLNETMPNGERTTVSQKEANLNAEKSPTTVNEEEANLNQEENPLNKEENPPNEKIVSQDYEKDVNLLVPCISNASQSNSNDPECNVLSTEDCTINFENGDENV